MTEVEDAAGLAIAPTLVNSGTLRAVGYPESLLAQLPTNLTQRDITPLANLLTEDIVGELVKRGSPSTRIEVLSLEGHLLPGHSGARF